LSRRWCEQFEHCSFVDATYTLEDHTFHGAITLRVKAGTGVDSLEKILRGRIKPPVEHEPIEASEPSPCIEEELRISKVMPHFEMPLRSAVLNDEDIGKFCKFYLDRLEEALQDMGRDPSRRAKVEGDLRPHVEAEIAGIEGVRYDHGRLKIKYVIEGHEYFSELRVIPASGQILEQPFATTCQQTKWWLPKDALAQCAASGELILLHRLERLDSGQYAAPEELVACQSTGQKILRTDSAVSILSGKVVRKDRLVRCAVSGDPALPSELRASDASGRLARPELLLTSAVSGKSGLPEEVVTCHPTQRTVLKTEAMRSQSTGNWYAEDQLVRSRLSGTAAPPPDMVKCEATQQDLLPTERSLCSVTRRWVAVNRIRRSEVSGLPVDEEVAVRTDNGQIGLPNEIGLCQWSNRTMFYRDMDRCTLSQLMVDHDLLNEEKELRELRNLLDGKVPGLPTTEDERRWVLSQPGWGKVGDVAAMRNRATNLAAIVGEARGWFGFGSRHIGGIANLGEPRQLISPALRGFRRNGIWFLER